MYFTCNRSALTNSINIVQKAVSSRSTLPILQGILLSVEQDKLILTGTDLEITIRTEMEVKSSENLRFVVDSKLFGDIIRRLPDEEVTITLKENNLAEIRSGKARFKISVMNPEEFPETPKIENAFMISLESDLVEDMIRKTIFSISKDDIRQVLKGGLLEFEDGLYLVTLDGYRMSIRFEKMEGLNRFKMIIPGKTLDEILKIIDDTEGNINIGVSNNHACFELGSTVIYSRLIEGEFINYKQLIPSSYNTRIKINTRWFYDSLERASIVLREEKSNVVRFYINEGFLKILGNTEVASVEEEVPIELFGDRMEIAFNPRYFMEALRVIDDEEIYIDFTTNLSPCVIRPLKGEKYIYIILPIRI